MPFSRDLSLYNGVSNRSRGWKSRKTEVASPVPAPVSPTTRKWDGAARTSSAWDNLRRDPELWYANGDCYIHLYGKGQSRRGPAFRLPYSILVSSRCYPLIDRYLAHDDDLEDDLTLGRDVQERRMNLYIPAPAGSDKQQSFIYHLATRNFFAWVFRRSIVGEFLGPALIALASTMAEFRTPQADNLADIVSYMDEEGYLDMKSQPVHALAVLQFAEAYEIRDMYIDAFAHCCGMSDILFQEPEYLLLSSVTRKLLRRCRVEMDLKLGQAGSMLASFLQDDLSESHLGLGAGSRAHLERFRTLLHGFYAVRFGYYPPPSIDPRTTIFRVDVLRRMRDDFEALFEYLVDEDFDISQSIPMSSQGGICTVQSVQSFDARHKFAPLNNPMPLLPESDRPVASNRMAWLKPQVMSTKLGPKDRAAIHVATLKATNQRKLSLLDNKLVRTYRKFEENCIYSPLRADKEENLSMADARKVRWILIYTTYQCLKQATDVPPEVMDAVDAPYNMCISTAVLPPWKSDKPLGTPLMRQRVALTRNSSTSTMDTKATSMTVTASSSVYTLTDIKPDVDYLGLEKQQRQAETPTPTMANPKIPSRRSSLAPAALQRRLSIFNRHATESDHKVEAPLRRRQSQYHEIVVHGYGNGTNDVEFALDDASELDTTIPDDHRQPHSNVADDGEQSLSASPVSSQGQSSSGSEPSSASTENTSVGDSLPDSPTSTYSQDSWGTKRRASCLNEDVAAPPPIPERSMSVRGLREQRSWTGPARPASIACGLFPSQHDDYDLEPEPLNIRKVSLTPHQQRPATAAVDYVYDHEDETQLFRHSSSDCVVQMPKPKSLSANAWEDIKELMEVRAGRLSIDDEHDDKAAVVHGGEWELYNDLGGLTECGRA